MSVMDSARAILDSAKAAPESRASRTVREIFESGRPVAYIRSSEERRVDAVLREIARRMAAPAPHIWRWTLTDGLRRDGEGPISGTGTRDPRTALDFILTYNGPAIFHLKDFHEPLRQAPEIRRRLRDVYEAAAGHRKYLVITSPVREIPEELERSLMYLDLRPPDFVELAQFVREE